MSKSLNDFSSDQMKNLESDDPWMKRKLNIKKEEVLKALEKERDENKSSSSTQTDSDETESEKTVSKTI